MRGFVDDDGARLAPQLLQPRAPRRLLGRQEAGEDEGIARQAGHRQRRHRGAGAGHGIGRHAGGAGGAHQGEAGVGDQRRAGVGDQGQRLAGLELPHQLVGDAVLVVVVQGDQRPLDAEMRQQLAAGAGVLGGDAIDPGQDAAGARRQVAEIADGSGDDVQRARHDSVTGVLRRLWEGS